MADSKHIAYENWLEERALCDESVRSFAPQLQALAFRLLMQLRDEGIRFEDAVKDESHLREIKAGAKLHGIRLLQYNE